MGPITLRVPGFIFLHGFGSASRRGSARHGCRADSFRVIWRGKFVGERACHARKPLAGLDAVCERDTVAAIAADEQAGRGAFHGGDCIFVALVTE